MTINSLLDREDVPGYRRRLGRLTLATALCLGVWSAGAAEDLPGRVISVLRSFEPDENFRWEGGASSANHADFNVVEGIREYSENTPFGLRCWKLTVDDPAPFSGWRKAGWENIDKVFLVGLLKIPHLPPEADVVRVRCKVLRGNFRLSVGGPVIQPGTSDVFADPVELDAVNCAEWRTVDFSLNHKLMRNFRRARYSRHSPVIYQTRWGQEDFCIVGLKKSEGVILIDQIELVSTGEGRPFPQFEPSQIQQISMIADFEHDRDLEKVATILHGYNSGQGQEDTFVQSWRRNPDEPNVARWKDQRNRLLDHEPMTYGIAVDGLTGKRSLMTRAHFAEEHSFALIRTAGEPRANAFKLVIKASAQNEDLRRESRTYWGTAVDFLVLVAPEGKPFPWDALAASEELRRHPGPGFDYEISLKRTAGVSYGYYHARRLIMDDSWTTMIIPFHDFVCGYGQKEMAGAFQQQLPMAGAQIAGIMYTGPIRFDMEVMIDEISYVHVPGDASSLHSYWQVPDISKIKLREHSWLRESGVQVLEVEK